MGTFTYLEQSIKEKYEQHHHDRPFIVAIDGLGGAGKTTLVHDLKYALNHVIVLHIDDYIVERKRRYETGYEEWSEYYHLQWDTSYLKKVLFEPLHRQEAQLCLPFYHKQEDRLENRVIDIHPQSIIMIEGVFLLREEWQAFYDLIIFLDCPKEIRHHRVLQRDTYIGNVKARLKKYENRYWPAEEYYLKQQKPSSLAHIVYDAKDDKNIST